MELALDKTAGRNVATAGHWTHRRFGAGLLVAFCVVGRSREAPKLAEIDPRSEVSMPCVDLLGMEGAAEVALLPVPARWVAVAAVVVTNFKSGSLKHAAGGSGCY